MDIDLIDEAKRMLEARFELSGEEEITPHAIARTPVGLVLMEMPGFDDLTQRQLLIDTLPTMLVSSVAVINECWRTCAATPEEEEMLRGLLAKELLHTAPPHLRKEAIRLYAEGVDWPIVNWRADIEHVDGKRVLQPWEELVVKLPRPTFKRYFPETP